MTDRASLTLSELSTRIATRVQLAAAAVAIGDETAWRLADLLVDEVRADMAEVERRVKAGGRKDHAEVR